MIWVRVEVFIGRYPDGVDGCSVHDNGEKSETFTEVLYMHAVGFYR